MNITTPNNPNNPEPKRLLYLQVISRFFGSLRCIGSEKAVLKAFAMLLSAVVIMWALYWVLLSLNRYDQQTSVVVGKFRGDNVYNDRPIAHQEDAARFHHQGATQQRVPNPVLKGHG